MALQIEDRYVANPHRSSCQDLSDMFGPAKRRAAAVDLFDRLSQSVHLGLGHLLDRRRGERRADPGVRLLHQDIAAGRNIDLEILQSAPPYPKHRSPAVDRTADVSQRPVIVAQNLLNR